MVSKRSRRDRQKPDPVRNTSREGQCKLIVNLVKGIRVQNDFDLASWMIGRV
ncbi:MAG: hypothetical protein Fues2KO_00300 [Fuerstiella sp.]